MPTHVVTFDKQAEAWVVSLDFSSAFDSVNHQDLLYKLKSMGVGGPVFNILEDFLTNHQFFFNGNFSQF